MYNVYSFFPLQSFSFFSFICHFRPSFCPPQQQQQQRWSQRSATARGEGQRRYNIRILYTYTRAATMNFSRVFRVHNKHLYDNYSSCSEEIKCNLIAACFRAFAPRGSLHRFHWREKNDRLSVRTGKKNVFQRQPTRPPSKVSLSSKCQIDPYARRPVNSLTHTSSSACQLRSARYRLRFVLFFQWTFWQNVKIESVVNLLLSIGNSPGWWMGFCCFVFTIFVFFTAGTRNNKWSATRNYTIAFAKSHRHIVNIDEFRFLSTTQQL